jgi:hypothetical protein
MISYRIVMRLWGPRSAVLISSSGHRGIPVGGEDGAAESDGALDGVDDG